MSNQLIVDIMQDIIQGITISSTKIPQNIVFFWVSVFGNIFGWSIFKRYIDYSEQLYKTQWMLFIVHLSIYFSPIIHLVNLTTAVKHEFIFKSNAFKFSDTCYIGLLLLAPRWSLQQIVKHNTLKPVWMVKRLLNSLLHFTQKPAK